MDYDALERLVKLRDQGALTINEFAEQKRILLAESDAENHEKGVENVKTFVQANLRNLSALSLAIGLC